MPGTRKLGKTTDQRKAMLRQQVTDLLDMGRMETTVFPRQKEVAPLAEKRLPLARRRTWLPIVRRWPSSPARMLPRRCSRKSPRSMPTATAATPGITRIGTRRGDAAEMAVIELV